MYGWLASRKTTSVIVNEFVLRRTREIKQWDMGIRHMNASSNAYRYYIMRNRGHMKHYYRSLGVYNPVLFGAGTALTFGKELIRLLVRRAHGARHVSNLFRGIRDGRKIAKRCRRGGRCRRSGRSPRRADGQSVGPEGSHGARCSAISRPASRVSLDGGVDAIGDELPPTIAVRLAQAGPRVEETPAVVLGECLEAPVQGDRLGRIIVVRSDREDGHPLAPTSRATVARLDRTSIRSPSLCSRHRQCASTRMGSSYSTASIRAPFGAAHCST